MMLQDQGYDKLNTKLTFISVLIEYLYTQSEMFRYRLKLINNSKNMWK